MKIQGMLAATAALFLSTTADAVEIDGSAPPYPVWHYTVLPGEGLRIDPAAGETVTIDGEVFAGGAWSADEPGNHTLVVEGADGRVLEASLFVLTPSSEIDSRGYIGEFRMGFYPKDTPEGFIRLEKGQGGMGVSPSFNVGQFLCKQQPGVWPKYLLVSDDNLVRLETLLADLKAEGLTEADTLFVMSGFRSPFYNSAIGSAKFSRHMYGDAADVYIDYAPRDGNMDDINSDGKVTKADANFLYDYAEELFAEEDVEKGGLGSYKANAVHGPFVHVDARGRAARWGR